MFKADIDGPPEPGVARTTLTAPCIDRNGRLVGVVHCINKERRRTFNRADERVLCQLCSRAATVLTNVSTFEVRTPTTLSSLH